MAEGVSRRDRWLLWGLMVWGVAVRLGLASLPRVIRWDEPDYLWLGRSLFSGQGYTIGPYPDLHYTPLLPVLVGPLTRLLPDLEWASAFWYVVLGAALVWPVYALGRAIFGPSVARGAAVYTACFPALTILPLHWGTMTEPPYLVLLFVGLYAAHRAWREGGLRHHVLAGAALALAYLVRPEGALAFAGVVAFLWAAAGLGERWRDRAWWVRFGGLVLAWLLVAGPYLLYLRAESGRWLLTGKVGVTLALGEGVLDRDPATYDQAIASLDAEGKEIIWFSPERFQEPGLLQQVRAAPGAVVRRVAYNLRAWYGTFFGLRMFPAPFVALVALGLFAVPWTRRRAADNLFLALACLPPFAFLFLHVEARFFAPLLPVLLLWAAAGTEVLSRWLRGTWGRLRHGDAGQEGPAWLGPVLWAAAALFLLALWPGTLAAGRATLDFGHKEMGLWLREHTPPDAVVMARDLAVPLYAERGYAPAPHASFQEIVRYAQQHGASYWATDAYELTRVKPHLAYLLDPGQRPLGLEVVYQAESPHGLNVVFRLPVGEGGAP